MCLLFILKINATEVTKQIQRLVKNPLRKRPLDVNKYMNQLVAFLNEFVQTRTIRNTVLMNTHAHMHKP